MSAENADHARSTCDRLAAALAYAGAPASMIAKAAAGYYDDYKSPLAMPITQLRADALALGLREIADRAANGDFDATKAEADAWAASEEGQATFRELTGHGRLPADPNEYGTDER